MIDRLRTGISMDRLLRISRPRFWIYVAGPFTIGTMLAVRMLDYPLTHVTPIIFVFLLYFLFPANLLIYGVNDIFDYETDRINPKKMGYEALVEPDEHRPLMIWVAVTTLPFLALFELISSPAFAALSVFVFLAVFYSAPPIRAKVIPFLDMIFSAGIYVSAGVFGYLLSGGQTLDETAIAAGMLWSMAMHAYSAVPDIEADRASGVRTVATSLGATLTLWLCFGLYFAAAIITLEQLGSLALVLGVVYCGAVLAALLSEKTGKVFELYTYFPVLNITAGFTIFIWLSVVARFADVIAFGEEVIDLSRRVL